MRVYLTFKPGGKLTPHPRCTTTLDSVLDTKGMNYTRADIDAIRAGKTVTMSSFIGDTYLVEPFN